MCYKKLYKLFDKLPKLTVSDRWSLLFSYLRKNFSHNLQAWSIIVVAILLVHLGTEIAHGHSVEDGFNFGNEGLFTFYSDSLLISHQIWFHLTIYVINALKIPDQIHHFTREVLVWLFHAGVTTDLDPPGPTPLADMDPPLQIWTPLPKFPFKHPLYHIW